VDELLKRAEKPVVLLRLAGNLRGHSSEDWESY
jgi:hypothetical protein